MPVDPETGLLGITQAQLDEWNALSPEEQAARAYAVKKEMDKRKEAARLKQWEVGVALGGFMAAPVIFPAGGQTYLFGGQPVITIADVPAGSTAAELGLPPSTITGAAGETAGGIGGALSGLWNLGKPAVETVSSVIGAVGALKETATKVQNIFSDSSVPAETGMAEYQKLQTQGQLTGAPASLVAPDGIATDTSMLYIAGGLLLLFLLTRK